MDELSAQEIRSLLPGAAPVWLEAVAAAIESVWSRELATEVHVAVGAPPVGQGPWQLSARATRVDVAQTEAPLRIETDRRLTAALIDAQAGASRTSTPPSRGTLTEIEQSLLSRALELLLPPLNDCFEHRLTLTSIAAVQPADDADSASPTAAFQVRLLESSGLLQLRMTAEQQQLAQPPAEPPAPREVTALLSELELPATDVADLAVGDIITTDTPADAPLELRDGDESHPATPGRMGDFKAVQPKGEQ